MLYLCIAIFAFYAGVFVHPALHSKTRALALIDAFIVLAVLVLLLLSLLPHTFEESGLIGGIGIGLGFGLTVALQRISDSSLASSRPWALAIVVSALFAHAILDGAALALPEYHQENASHSVVIGVLLHRFPLGMVVHHLLGPKLFLPILVATLISLFTVTGFLFADQVLNKAQETTQYLLEAFVIGMLVHVVFTHIGTLKKLVHPTA